MRKNYYSLTFEKMDDPSTKKDVESGIEILKHDNTPDLDDEFIENEPNHFKTRSDALKAKKKIVEFILNA